MNYKHPVKLWWMLFFLFFCPNDFEGNEAGKYYCCDKLAADI
jgi:hypothetical protein